MQLDDDVFEAPFKCLNVNADNIGECKHRFPHMLFLNHSCGANAGYIDWDKLYAIRDINIGEEITINYGCFEDINSLSVGLKCQCGSNDKCQQILRMDF